MIILKLDPGFEPATYGLVLAFQLQSSALSTWLLKVHTFEASVLKHYYHSFNIFSQTLNGSS